MLLVRLFLFYSLCMFLSSLFTVHEQIDDDDDDDDKRETVFSLLICVNELILISILGGYSVGAALV